MTDGDMPLTTHLAELRALLIRIAAALLVTFSIAWAFHDRVFAFMAEPVMRGLAPHGIDRLQAIRVTEGIVVHMKASGVAAILLASPFIIWQVWGYVSPALKITERRVGLMFGGLVTLFFGLGVLFAYAIFVPLVVDFLAGFGMESGTMVLAPTLENTFGMAMLFLIMFGVIFELPLIMLFLGALHIMRPRTMLGWSRYFIVGAFIVAAIFTPPEPVSQTLMAVPMCVLYMLGILLAWAGWNVGGNNRRRRALASAIAAVGIFSGGIVFASLQWNDARAGSDAGGTVAGSSAISISLDSVCANAVAGWGLKPGETLLIQSGANRDGIQPVRFRTDAGTVTDAAGAGDGPVGRFVRANIGAAWTVGAPPDLELMVLAPSGRFHSFVDDLLDFTTKFCSGTSGVSR